MKGAKERRETYTAGGADLDGGLSVELDVTVFVVVDVDLQHTRNVDVATAGGELASPHSPPATVPSRLNVRIAFFSHQAKNEKDWIAREPGGGAVYQKLLGLNLAEEMQMVTTTEPPSFLP